MSPYEDIQTHCGLDRVITLYSIDLDLYRVQHVTIWRNIYLSTVILAMTRVQQNYNIVLTCIPISMNQCVSICVNIEMQSYTELCF
jgi:hypothetical protein